MDFATRRITTGGGPQTGSDHTALVLQNEKTLADFLSPLYTTSKFIRPAVGYTTSRSVVDEALESTRGCRWLCLCEVAVICESEKKREHMPGKAALADVDSHL